MFNALSATLALLLTSAPARSDITSDRPPTVRPERPRVFLRAKAWDGPSIEKIRRWMKLPEYRQRAKKLHRTAIGNALLYLLTDDKAAGKRAVEGLKRFRIGGSSPSYSGIEAQKCAALYDWLHDHPDLDPESRAKIIAHLEHWGDYYLRYLKSGGPTPFYSRISGAIAGLTAIGLSLHGDSPKADKYVRYAAYYLKNKIGTIRQVEDGATGFVVPPGSPEALAGAVRRLPGLDPDATRNAIGRMRKRMSWPGLAEACLRAVANARSGSRG